MEQVFLLFDPLRKVLFTALSVEVGLEHVGERVDQVPLFCKERSLGLGRHLFKVHDLDDTLLPILHIETGRL